jgi:PAS domain S-box-containing protein
MSEDKDFFKYLRKLKLLYVEDDNNTREELEYFLKNKVSELLVARNGLEGFELFEKHQPDLIITDIQMPIMTGTKMIKLIKQINPTIPIIIITAFNDADYLFEAIKLNVTSYLTKPLNLFSLSEELSNISKSINLENENKQMYNSLKQYKDIIDERSIISKTDINGVITYVNEPFEKITGYSKDELIGYSHNKIIHSEIKEDIFQNILKKINVEKKLWQGRLKNFSKNGEVYFIDTIIKPILDLDENIIEFISLSNDITDLEKTKEYFKTQTQKSAFNLSESIRIVNAYKEAINESNIILRTDLNRNIIYVNDAFCKISAYTQDELLGKPYSFLKYNNLTHEEETQNLDEIFSENIWKGTILNFNKNSGTFYCDVTIYPLKDKNGKVVEYMGIHHDITDIENLYKELEDTQREIIYKLGEIGECRSSETGQHVKRVAEYSKLIAHKIGLDDKDISKLFMASPMHDIGKVGIPDSILNKNGKLDPDEWEIMKTHAQIGYDILKTSKRDILQSAAIVSFSHHEKWDGSGYPLGLKGEEIHIFGRITAVADVFDALGSDRVYKKAWPLEKILELFKEEKGKHFDPNLIDIFLNNLNEFIEIKERYKDVN